VVRVEFGILGGVRASHGGSELPLGGPRHRRLLTVLLLHANEVVSPGQLIDALWGDEPPRSAGEMLHVRVSELRAALRAGRPERDAGLLTRGGGYLLRVDAGELDASAFERLAGAGEQALAAGEHARARGQLREALALWRGPALADFADQPFARTEAARLEELRLRALEGRLAAELALGGGDDLVAELDGLVAAHPLRERFWWQLMLALYRAGRQGEALEAYRRARRVLADQLGVEPGGELRRLQEAILRHDPALDAGPQGAQGPPARPAGNLPAPLTGFVGRRRDLAEIRALLRTDRLVTLTGVGGAGKSRLAVEVAAASRPDFPDGTWLVELAELAQPGLVASAVAAALGVREHPRRPLADLLTERMTGAEALLVLDNCEHVVVEAAELAERLLRGCAGLRIVATSRERLGITGERLWPVSGLGVPPADATDAATVGRSEAVRLLAQRAAAVQPGFALTDATAAATAQICQRLDGLPLALELAAAGVNAFGVQQIAARLDDRFRLLTQGSRTAPPRHRTLRAAVDWSYEALGEGQRRLFERLSVFVGGFTLEAAEAVGGGDRVPELLASLVDKSLLAVEEPGAPSPRYRMPETLRAYGLERLAESGAAAAQRDRHAAYVLALVRSARRQMRGAGQPAWLRRLEAEHGNIRAALAWSVGQGDAATAVRLAGSLYPLWDRHGHYREGRRWLSRALALDAPVPPLVRARALDSAAGLAAIQGDLDEAGTAAAEAAMLSRREGDPAGVARALTTIGFVAIYADDLRRAAAVLDESLRHARQAGDGWSEGFALTYLTCVALAESQYDRAAALAAQCERVMRSLGDPEGLAAALALRGVVAWRDGDRAAAQDALDASLRLFESMDHRWGLSLGLYLAAELALAGGEPDRAVSRLAASEALRESIGAALMPFWRAWIDTALARCRSVLDAAAFDRAWRAGRSVSPELVVADALRQRSPAGLPDDRKAG
jgi:predicted ATPase/DNA-binding SARP family transcriptional activator